LAYQSAAHSCSPGTWALPSFKLPEQVEFVDVLPRPDMGKAAKKLLRNRYLT
jgi:non-ribosomal peptide synthetase component E (peptide arylation enzyme)